jgi:NTE family protein
MTNGRGRALVLGGGGVAGISWLLGMIEGLRGAGIDVGAADLLVGTSAGSCAGTQLATGALKEASGLQLREDSAEIEVEFDLSEYLRTLQAATTGARDERDAARRVANLEAVTSVPVDPSAGARLVAARIPVKEWPSRELVVTAVDRQTGELVCFRRESGVSLVDAVTVSCALPGSSRRSSSMAATTSTVALAQRRTPISRADTRPCWSSPPWPRPRR